MQYIKPDDARTLPGLRLAATAHVPAPYSMSARAIFEHHNVPFTLVEQTGGGANDRLVTWTGHRNAPVAVYENEVPRVGWLDILNLAERLGSGTTLLPEDINERMLMIGMINELIGENGWVWNMRLVMLGLGGPEQALQAAEKNPMYQDYGYTEGSRAAALDRARVILARFTDFVRSGDGGYLCAGQLSAIDVYWVYFSNLLETLPEADCPMPNGLRRTYDAAAALLGAYDPILIRQRDFIIAEHLALPMTF